MKKHHILLLTLISLIFALPSHAQTEKGNYLVGGSLNFGNNSTSGGSVTTAGLSPTVSYFFVDRFAAGVILNLSTAKFNSDNNNFNGEYRTTNVEIGPTARYYFMVEPKFAVFPEVDLTFGTITDKFTNNGVKTSSSSTSSTLKLGVGGAYFIARNVGLEGFLFYQSVSQQNTADQNGINFRLGLQVYINRSKS